MNEHKKQEVKVFERMEHSLKLEKPEKSEYYGAIGKCSKKENISPLRKLKVNNFRRATKW